MKKFIPISGLFAVLAFLSSIVIFGQNYPTEKFRYISPKPGSEFVNPANSIAVRQGDAFNRQALSNEYFIVRGSLSGNVQGKVKLSSDGQTIIFNPVNPFKYGEQIFVEIKEGLKTISGKELAGLKFDFTIQPVDNTQMLIDFYQTEYEQEISMIESQNSAGSQMANPVKISNNYPEDFPAPYITEMDNPTEGYIFCTLRVSQSPTYKHYIAILDKYGVPVYYRKAQNVPNDLKVIPEDNLAFCNFNNADVPSNAYYVMDQWFDVIDTLKMGNGYYVDQHDMLVLESGDRIMMAYDPQLIDMSQIVPGGDPNATVIGFIVQRLDSEDNVTFQWRSWDYFEITDATDLDLTSDRIDYVHGNAFDLDDNQTTLLMSCRTMDEITKIDLATGDIIWRLGLHAINNEFTFIDDTIGFCRQHDIRVLPNGNITLYDNGNCHNPAFSQSWEYALDIVNMTATPVWNYIRDPFVYGSATGSSRRHNDGNTLICWGFTNPIGMTEVRPDGSTTWELNVVENGVNYRAVKSTWETTLFELSEYSVDFGTYDDYIPWPKIIVITNNSDQDIEITSTQNYLNSYQVITPLPLNVPAGGSINFQFQLFPSGGEEGHLDDVLTLNYDSFVLDDLPQRIARQIAITAYVQDDNPPEAAVDPVDGSTTVPLNTQVKINFNESVVKTDGNTLKSIDIPDVIEFRETDASGPAVEYTAFIDAWKRQIVITPQLKSNQQYYVELKANSVSDKDGNILATAETSTFTTEDVEAPVVVFFPEDSAVDVKRNVVVTITFNEKIFKSGGDEITDADLPEMLVYKETDTLGVDVVYTAVLNEDKTEIQIMADEDLVEFQQYYVAFLGNMVQDEAGNMVEMGKSITFTTGDEFGINDYNWNSTVRVFPNPNKGLMTLEFSSNDPKSIELFNAKGKVIFASQSVVGNILSIDISNQPLGIYFIRVINLGSGVSSELKVIKN
ncbi:MAG: Ig-like domain-containing protein [Bacteroidales bacterium]|nr:Ig-like domain-containing protein [Bacteroidales bacterium]